MSEEEKQKRIADLTAQLTPRGVYEALHYGTAKAEGRRFLETYAAIRELEGDKVTIHYAG